MAMTVGFFDEVGRAGRAPLCSWRARLAATMIKRLMLCSGSSGIEQWALFLTVFSGIGKSLTRFYFKRRQNRLDARLHSDPAHPLGPHDGGQRFGGRLQIIIDQQVIVLTVIPDFASGIAQPALDHVTGILRAGTQPLFEDLAGWRQDKNGNRVRNLTLQLSRTLDINVEHEVLALPLGQLEGGAVRAVVIAEDIGMLQELIPGHARFEF